MKILVLTAMESEYEQFLSFQKDASLGDKQLYLSQCGIGKVNSAVQTFDLVNKFSPDLVISSGVAGSCSDEVEIMDVVCGERYIYHDAWCGQPNALGQIQGLPKEYFAPKQTIDKIKSLNLKGVHIGQIVSGDWFVDTKEKMQSIKENFPYSLAVDMESTSIAQVCYKLNTSFLSLRVISDLPLKGNNHQQYKDFWTNVSQTSFLTAKKIIQSI
jgi:adenosylhomocysteine nucleosidase